MNQYISSEEKGSLTLLHNISFSRSHISSRFGYWRWDYNKWLISSLGQSVVLKVTSHNISFFCKMLLHNISFFFNLKTTDRQENMNFLCFIYSSLEILIIFIFLNVFPQNLFHLHYIISFVIFLWYKCSWLICYIF